MFLTILSIAYVWFTRIRLFSMLCRTHIHPLLCRGTSLGLHIATGLTLDEASSAALVRMMVGCPQLTELKLIGTFKLFRLFRFCFSCFLR
jgi:formylmethanofuran dehydrogenase subunit E-like metal-binding protein